MYGGFEMRTSKCFSGKLDESASTSACTKRMERRDCMRAVLPPKDVPCSRSWIALFCFASARACGDKSAPMKVAARGECSPLLNIS